MKYLLISFLFAFGASAQQLAPESINSSGGKMTQTNGSLSYTVGELVVTSFEDGQGNTLNGGFTAGATITTVSILAVNPAVLSVSVYPNPTTAFVTIKITEANTEPFILEIIDNTGKIITTNNYSGVSSKIGINCNSWSNGIYYLNIKSKDQSIIGTYKIIKQ
jgi:hypothetical protein